jgi:Transposase
MRSAIPHSPTTEVFPSITLSATLVRNSGSAIPDTLEEHQDGILAYYDYPISTGPLEGTNTKVQAMKRQAYGFRDHEFFKLKILGIHETKHALVG